MLKRISTNLLVICLFIALCFGLVLLNEFLIFIESTISIIGRFLIMTLGSLTVLYMGYAIIMKITREPIKTEVDALPFKAKAFGIADKAENCFAGTINSSIPFQKGQLHRVKGKQWSVASVEKNHLNETLVKMNQAD